MMRFESSWMFDLLEKCFSHFFSLQMMVITYYMALMYPVYPFVRLTYAVLCTVCLPKIFACIPATYAMCFVRISFYAIGKSSANSRIFIPFDENLVGTFNFEMNNHAKHRIAWNVSLSIFDYDERKSGLLYDSNLLYRLQRMLFAIKGGQLAEVAHCSSK